MTGANEKLFVEALARDEVDRFLAGEPPYFVVTRADNEEPQNVPAAFNAHVFLLWRSTHDAAIPASLLEGLMRLLREHPDKNRAIYVVDTWVWNYYFWLREKHQQPSGSYSDLFDLDLTPVAILLKDAMEANKDALTRDQRWAGVTWNSSDGLWTPLVRSARAVRDNLGGPDYVPANA